MVEFLAGLLVGGILVTVILGLHFVKLTEVLRRQIDCLQTELNHLRLTATRDK